jgi:hypothetical protein
LTLFISQHQLFNVDGHHRDHAIENFVRSAHRLKLYAIAFGYCRETLTAYSCSPSH